MNDETPTDRFEDRLYEQFARVGKALASRRRLEILGLLAQGEKRVEEVADRAGLSTANASHHLRKLLDARLVEVRREGPYAYYRLASDRVFELLATLRAVAEERLAEIDRLVEQYLEDRRELDAVTLEELRREYGSGDVVVIDVRPDDEYRAGHIEGARSVPLEEIDEALEELPDDREIVAYCRGPYCLLSDDAVERLRARGYRARRLNGGFPEWRARGLPVEEPGGTR
ncbi:MAG: ArsR/SmtB family transcription factor [Gemmatimonadota bacterium]